MRAGEIEAARRLDHVPLRLLEHRRQQVASGSAASPPGTAPGRRRLRGAGGVRGRRGAARSAPARSPAARIAAACDDVRRAGGRCPATPPPRARAARPARARRAAGRWLGTGGARRSAPPARRRPRAARSATACGSAAPAGGRAGPRGSASRPPRAARSALVAAMTRTSAMRRRAAAERVVGASTAGAAAASPARAATARRSRRATAYRPRRRRTLPSIAPRRAGEGAGLGAEQLALEQGLGDRGAVQLDERRAARAGRCRG